VSTTASIKSKRLDRHRAGSSLYAVFNGWR